MLWIQSIVDYILNLPQILSKRIAQQQQAHPTFHHPSKGLDSSKLEHTWFNSSDGKLYMLSVLELHPLFATF